MKLLFVSTKWCSHCDTCKKSMESNPVDVKIEFVNPDDDINLIDRYSIRYIPAIVVIDNNGDMVKKYENFDWDDIKPEIEKIIEGK